MHKDLSGGISARGGSVEACTNVVTKEIHVREGGTHNTCSDRQCTPPISGRSTHMRASDGPQPPLLPPAPETSEKSETREPLRGRECTDSGVTAEIMESEDGETGSNSTGSDTGSETGSNSGETGSSTEETGGDRTPMDEDSGRSAQTEHTPREMVERESKDLLLIQLDKILKENRNKEFKKIVIDRRGRGVPRLVCFSTDTVLICDTGTLERDFYIMKGPLAGDRRPGDDLADCCKAWPDIDRGGEYKEMIDALKTELPLYMYHIGCVFGERLERIRLK